MYHIMYHTPPQEAQPKHRIPLLLGVCAVCARTSVVRGQATAVPSGVATAAVLAPYTRTTDVPSRSLHLPATAARLAILCTTPSASASHSHLFLFDSLALSCPFFFIPRDAVVAVVVPSHTHTRQPHTHSTGLTARCWHSTVYTRYSDTAATTKGVFHLHLFAHSIYSCPYTFPSFRRSIGRLLRDSLPFLLLYYLADNSYSLHTTMSSLQVLALGHNPSILLYTSRFQLANSVELYHISDADSSVFEIETRNYGSERLELQRHFRSVEELTASRASAGSSEPLAFDIVILAASSLQQLSAVSGDLTDYINASTKVFVESTAFVQLESFVKMSMNVSHLNVFSILNDFDIRETAPNKYKQFNSAPGSAGNTIFLGDASVRAKEYDPAVANLLKTFERLFQKLFPRDTISLCGGSPYRFLAEQWALAIPAICFDPLLIMLEETQPSRLREQILAKPLVAGLVAEVLRITAAMDVKLKWDSEQALLDHWEAAYPTSEGAVPPLLFHFLNRTAPLNFDISLLQAILLADDFNLKTPYLEFLYSIMVQLQKLNDNKSKWFIRADTQTREKESESNAQLQMYKDKAVQLQAALTQNEAQVKTLQGTETSLTQQLEMMKSKMAAFEADNAKLVAKHDAEMKSLQAAMQSARVTEQNAQPTATKSVLNGVAAQQDGSGSGTPLLHDLQDFAGYGVNYGDSPVNNMVSPRANHQSSEHLEPNSSSAAHSHRSDSKSNHSSDTSLKERELDLRRKELELQERELEIQKRAMQMQMQRFPNQQQMQYNTASRKSSMANMQQMPHPPPQQQQQQGQVQNNFPRSSRMLHGASAPTMTVSAGEFVDPIAGGAAYPNNGFQNYPGQPNANPQYQQHGFKPTSRKNRASNMQMLGSASSAPSASNSYNNYSRPNTANAGNAGPQGMGQPRMGSASGQGMVMNQNRNRPGQNPSPYNANPRNASNSMASLQQRQASSAFAVNGQDGNTTTNTVIHTMQSQSTNNLNGVKQSYAPVQLSESTPNIAASQSGSNTAGAVNLNGSSIQPPSMPGTPDMSSSNDQASATGSEKDGKKKKKKFSLFKKKAKK